MFLSILARVIKDFTFEPELEDYTIHVPAASESTSNSGTNPTGIQLDPDLATPDNPILVPKSNLRLFPPPLFSRQGIQQNYKYVFLPFSFSEWKASLTM